MEASSQKPGLSRDGDICPNPMPHHSRRPCRITGAGVVGGVLLVLSCLLNLYTAVMMLAVKFYGVGNVVGVVQASQGLENGLMHGLERSEPNLNRHARCVYAANCANY